MAGEEKEELVISGDDKPLSWTDVSIAPPGTNGVVADSETVLVFLNGASGGRMGATVMKELGKHVPTAHIFNLEEVKRKEWIPEEKLKLFEGVEGVKVLICGGDGTMGWILSCIDRMPLSPDAFPVAMMPLGTGNDLARTYGWGPGFARAMLKPKFLGRVRAAKASKLDRWLLSVMPYDPLADDEKIKNIHLPPTFSVHKYASAIGSLSSGGRDFGPLTALMEPRKQSVLRVGRSFSVKMSSIAKMVHEDEMNRSSSHHGGPGAMRDGHDSLSMSNISEGSRQRDSLTASDATGQRPPHSRGSSSSGLARAVSAPPVMRASSLNRRSSGSRSNLNPNGGGQLSPPLPTVGEGVLSPVSDVSDTRSSVWDQDSAAAATTVTIAAGAAAMADEDEEKKQDPNDGTTQQKVTGGGDKVVMFNGPSSTDVVYIPPEIFPQPPNEPPEEEKKEVGQAGTTLFVPPPPASSGVPVVSGGDVGAAVIAVAGGKSSGAEQSNAGESTRRDAGQHQGMGRGGGDGEDGKDVLKAKRNSKEVAVQTEAVVKAAAKGDNEEEGVVQRPGPPRAMPSISVIQRYETWESYDAVFCNYFSFGVDAVAANAFHEYREQYPQLFTSRCRNQTWYARKGFPAAGGIPCASPNPPPFVSKYLNLRIRRDEGGEWEQVELDPGYRGVVVLNLQSYGGGRNLWGSAQNGCSSRQFAKAAPDDKLLEIVGISNIFKLGCIMACNKTGARAHRLCQAAEVEMRVKLPIHMQIDGEPWLQEPAKINIQHYGQSTCLMGKD